LSALKDERVAAAKILKRPSPSRLRRAGFVQSLRRAVRASIVVSYAQGFHLMRAASKEYGYGIPFAEVARIWKGGCIIRARLLDSITHAFRANENLSNLIVDARFSKDLIGSEKSWRGVVKAAKDAAVPVPAIGASLDYFDGYRSNRLPANLIQALRDRFGAHGYERIDRPGQFHIRWSG